MRMLVVAASVSAPSEFVLAGRPTVLAHGVPIGAGGAFAVKRCSMKAKSATLTCCFIFMITSLRSAVLRDASTPRRFARAWLMPEWLRGSGLAALADEEAPQALRCLLTLRSLDMNLRWRCPPLQAHSGRNRAREVLAVGALEAFERPVAQSLRKLFVVLFAGCYA